MILFACSDETYDLISEPWFLQTFNDEEYLSLIEEERCVLAVYFFVVELKDGSRKRKSPTFLLR